jgi:hypothetical protein
MRELISRLLLAIDEAWLDHGSNIIYRSALSDTDDRLERLLFEMEGRLAGLAPNAACVIKPRATIQTPRDYWPSHGLPQSTASHTMPPTYRARYFTADDHVLLRNSQAALERSRTLLRRVTNKTARISDAPLSQSHPTPRPHPIAYALSHQFHSHLAK